MVVKNQENLSKYQIRPLKETDFDKVSLLLSSSFTEREPTTVAMNFNLAEHLPLARSLVAKALKDGLSIVAETNFTGSIAGFSLSEDFSTVHCSPPFLPKYAPVLSILEALSEERQREFINRKGEALHILMIGIHSDHVRKGLGTQLALASLEVAKKAGFQCVVTEATSKYSQIFFSNLGFQCGKEIRYSDFSFRGETPFAIIPEPEKCILMEKQLQYTM